MTDTIAGIVLILLIIVNIVNLLWITWITFNVIRNEKRRKTYTSKMKIGDEVYKPITSGGITGEVLEINGDEVKMLIMVNKSELYPLNK